MNWTTTLHSERWAEDAAAVPPYAHFLVGAVFHYLEPAFAVLRFDHVAVVGGVATHRGQGE